MRQGVDKGIVSTGCLRQYDGEFADQRGDFRCISPGAYQANNRERTPGHNPEHDVDTSHFSNADFSGNGLLVAVAPQRSDVHLFGLLTEFIFVVENSTDDEIVTANDYEDRNDVKIDGRGQNVVLVVHIGG